MACAAAEKEQDVLLIIYPHEAHAILAAVEEQIGVHHASSFASRQRTDVEEFGPGSFKCAKYLLPKGVITSESTSTLQRIVEQHSCDLFIASATFFSTQKKLVCFDMDSCLIANECIDEMAAVYGKGDEVSAITRQAMHEGTPFDEALRKRVTLLKGMTKEQLDSVWARLELNTGAARLVRVLRQAGVRTAVVSGGFTIYACRVAKLLGCDYAFSNTLLFDENGQLTGEVSSPIVNGQVKEQVLRALAAKHQLAREELVAIGDGANDRWMVAHAGLGVAYHAKHILKQATPHHINHSSLDSLAYFMNLHPSSPAPSPSLHSLAIEAPQQQLEFLPLGALLDNS